LSQRHDIIAIEGAGSPAEINLSNDEVVNMSVARYAKAPVILVGDIDKGGVFASLYGTIALLDGDADYIKAFIINKFRGDLTILQPGLEMIRAKTNRSVLGVIPYRGDLGLHEEDGIPVERLWWSDRGPLQGPMLKIVVIRLRYISNFTDFDPFLYEPDTELIYSLRDADIENADLVIIPGSKNTVEDLLFLREAGIERSIKRATAKGIPIVGVCGGYQMLGIKLYDPYGIESPHRDVDGMGLLDIETVLENSKVTAQVEATRNADCGKQIAEGDSDKILRGYEIHMGRTTGEVGLFSIKRMSSRPVPPDTIAEPIQDGSAKGNVWGTYIHGIFDNDLFRRGLINSLRTRRGVAPSHKVVDFEKVRDHALDQWADLLRTSTDMRSIKDLVSSRR